MSDFTLSPPILAAILCNAPPPSSFSAPLLIIIAQSLTVYFNCKYFPYYTRELLECRLGISPSGRNPCGGKNKSHWCSKEPSRIWTGHPLRHACVDTHSIFVATYDRAPFPRDISFAKVRLGIAGNVLLNKARRVILELACLASVSMWFPSKERPRNDVEQDFLFRIERRLVRIHLCVEL